MQLLSVVITVGTNTKPPKNLKGKSGELGIHKGIHKGASLVAQSLPEIWETWVRFLGQEDPLEKEMASHSSTIAWKIPWTEEPCSLQSMGLQRVEHD